MTYDLTTVRLKYLSVPPSLLTYINTLPSSSLACGYFSIPRVEFSALLKFVSAFILQALILVNFSYRFPRELHSYYSLREQSAINLSRSILL